MKYTKARYIFLVYLSCCVAFLAASVTQRDQRGIGMCFPISCTVQVGL